jgi:hypothetical protein
MRPAIFRGTRLNHSFKDWNRMRLSFKKKEESKKKQDKENLKNLGKNKKKKRWREFLKKKDLQL